MLEQLRKVPRIRGNLIVISGPSGSGKDSVLSVVLSGFAQEWMISTRIHPIS